MSYRFVKMRLFTIAAGVALMASEGTTALKCPVLTLQDISDICHATIRGGAHEIVKTDSETGEVVRLRDNKSRWSNKRNCKQKEHSEAKKAKKGGSLETFMGKYNQGWCVYEREGKASFMFGADQIQPPKTQASAQSAPPKKEGREAIQQDFAMDKVDF